MAATYNVFSPYRDFCMKNILNACIEKKWSTAKDLAEDYVGYCKTYYEQYTSANLNFEFNKCGYCSLQKQSIVKSKWPEAEKYPFHGQLVCMNYTCQFYLILNVDQYEFLTLD